MWFTLATRCLLQWFYTQPLWPPSTLNAAVQLNSPGISPELSDLSSSSLPPLQLLAALHRTLVSALCVPAWISIGKLSSPKANPWHVHLGKHTRDKDTDFSSISKALCTTQASHQLKSSPRDHRNTEGWPKFYLPSCFSLAPLAHVLGLTYCCRERTETF